MCQYTIVTIIIPSFKICFHLFTHTNAPRYPNFSKFKIFQEVYVSVIVSIHFKHFLTPITRSNFRYMLYGYDCFNRILGFIYFEFGCFIDWLF